MTDAPAKSPPPAGPLSPDDPARRIGIAWRELRRGASMQGLRELIHGDGVEPLEMAQADALELLCHQGPLRMRELADALRVDASTATRTVDRLTRAGLAERTADPADARVVRVAPTHRGRERQAAVGHRARTVLAEVLEVFDERERRELADLMERLVTSVDAVVGTTSASR